MFSQWYEQAKAYAQVEARGPAEQEAFGKATAEFLQQTLQNLSVADFDERFQAALDVIEILQTKPKFQSLEAYVVKEILSVVLWVARAALNTPGCHFGPAAAFINRCSECPSFKISQGQLAILLTDLCNALAKSDSVLEQKAVSDLIVKLVAKCDSFVPTLANVINLTGDVAVPNTLFHVQREILTLARQTPSAHLYEALMGHFLMPVSSSLQVGLLAKLDEKGRHFAVQALMQAVTHCASEQAVARVTGCLKAISNEFDAEIQRICDALAVNCPCVSLVQFLFSFPLSRETVSELTAICQKMELAKITQFILRPLALYLRKLPQKAVESIVLAEVCVTLASVFQQWIAPATFVGALNRAELMEAALELLSCMVELLRRGYGVNERFTPMIKKIIKQSGYEAALLRLLCTSAEEDTLAERKIFAEIIRETCVEAEPKVFETQLVKVVLSDARENTVSLMAVLELIHNAPTARVIARPENCLLLLEQNTAASPLYKDLLEELIRAIPHLVLSYKCDSSHRILSACLEALVMNFDRQPQLMDSHAYMILLALFQLGDQYVVTPPCLGKLLGCSWKSAPCLALYLPELFIGHPNYQARACAYLFLLQKYCLEATSAAQKINEEQRNYFQQFLPTLIRFILLLLEQPDSFELTDVFNSSLQQQYKQQIHHQLAFAQARVLVQVARFGPQAKEAAARLFKEKVCKKFGKEVGGADQMAAFQHQIEEQQQCATFDTLSDLDTCVHFFLGQLDKFCGCGCNTAGWNAIMEVFTAAGVEWSNV